MSKVVMDVSMSLDGFSAGPNIRPAEPMGDGGERLHEWASPERDRTPRSTAPSAGELDAMVGATIIGRRTFDLGLAPWGGHAVARRSSFVVAHRTREDLLGDNGGTFAFDGLEAAARRAKAAAVAGTRTLWRGVRTSAGS